MERIPFPRLRIRSSLSLPYRALSRTRWTCPTCHQSSQPGRGSTVWRRLASSQVQTGTTGGGDADADSSKKPYYVTTPIFYVNASPHIGHMYTMVLADVLKRWKALQGQKALLCTGTDEHGMKVQRAAALNRVDPKQFCDSNSSVFRRLAESSHVDNDFFIRTTDEDHKEAVVYFWQMLVDRGYIYEDSHEGWYCVSDETFYPESQVERKIDTMTGKVHMASVETGNEVEWLAEKTYHFRMTALRGKLLAFYDSNPDWVQPSSRMKEVVGWVKNNLEDLSVSRPASRLDWGIRVPNDPSQTIYVWLDALVNYLTKAGYPNWTPGRRHEGGWPADVQVIGKDILRFHCVYWPALLLALDIPPPTRILSHAHWTLGRKKMSKSTGNVVNPFLAIDRFGVDAIRAFLVGHGGIRDDADYGNELVVDLYKHSLQNGLGNLTSRLVSSKLWSVRNSVQTTATAGGIPEEDGPSGFSALDDSARRHLFPRHRTLLNSLQNAVEICFDELNPGLALQRILDVISETNKFFSATEPWVMAKSPDADVDSSRKLAEVIFLTAESLRICGILLQPFMPEKAKELLDVLGVAEDKRTAAGPLRVETDFDYGVPLRSIEKSEWTGLFPALPIED